VNFLYIDNFTLIEISDQEHKQIVGLYEFETAVTLLHNKKYAESENYLKETLKILKQAG